MRILAHLAGCKSMLDAFKAGGDFHSQTAMNMYPYILDAVKDKRVLLEWDAQLGEEKPPVPLLKVIKLLYLTFCVVYSLHFLYLIFYSNKEKHLK